MALFTGRVLWLGLWGCTGDSLLALAALRGTQSPPDLPTRAHRLALPGALPRGRLQRPGLPCALTPQLLPSLPPREASAHGRPEPGLQLCFSDAVGPELGIADLDRGHWSPGNASQGWGTAEEPVEGGPAVTRRGMGLERALGFSLLHGGWQSLLSSWGGGRRHGTRAATAAPAAPVAELRYRCALWGHRPGESLLCQALWPSVASAWLGEFRHSRGSRSSVAFVGKAVPSRCQEDVRTSREETASTPSSHGEPGTREALQRCPSRAPRPAQSQVHGHRVCPALPGQGHQAWSDCAHLGGTSEGHLGGLQQTAVWSSLR